MRAFWHSVSCFRLSPRSHPCRAWCSSMEQCSKPPEGRWRVSRADAIEREIRTATGDSEKLLLTPMGGDLFRLEESSFVTDAVYRDVIRPIETEHGALLFVEIAERSPPGCVANRTPWVEYCGILRNCS